VNRVLARLAILAAFATACSSAASSATPGSGGTTPPVETPPGETPPTTPPGTTDSGSSTDAGADVAGSHDILGTISGASCGTIASLLTSPSPSLLGDALVFVAGETYDKPSLSAGGQRLYDTPNAGGSSTESEVMSFEVLHACDGATLLKTETEVGYTAPDANGGNAITDLEVEIAGSKVGVSVTRAYKPSSQTLTDADVKALLEKKLVGIEQSSARVLPADKWVKQILHVFAATQDASDAVGRVWPTIDAATRADTIVLVTHTTGGGFIYCHPTPALGSECP
jgi:hypothetical protein